MFTVRTKRLARRKNGGFDSFEVPCRSGQNCNSGSTSHRATSEPRKLEQELSIPPGSRTTPARFRRSVRHSCGSRLLAGKSHEPAQDEKERRNPSPPSLPPLSSQQRGGGSGDGIKERWSGLYSRDTSEATSLLAGFSRATSPGCSKKRVQKRSACIGHRRTRRRRRVDK